MESIKAKVIKIVYKNDDNGYCICKIKYGINNISAKGYFDVLEGYEYEFIGEIVDDAKYNETLIVKKIAEIIENSSKGIINYFSSSQFSGIGKHSAQLIYDHFGDEAISILKKDPYLIHEVENLRENVVNEIIKKLSTSNFQNTLYELLVPLNISDYLINKIHFKLKHLKDPLLALKTNPYQLMQFDEDGISFLIVDKIYLAFNEDPYSKLRLEHAFIYYFIELSFHLGDSLVLLEDMKQCLIKKLGICDALYDELIKELIADNKIVIIDKWCQLKTYQQVEHYLANNLLLRLKYFDNDHKIALNEAINEIEKQVKMNFSKEQKEAISLAFNKNISIITGGPGTGKTTIIKAIVAILIQYYYPEANYDELIKKIALVAPTGRASHRIMESSGFSAKTIHSLLNIHQNKKPEYDEFNKLPCEVIIIDEFSMVDMFLFGQLLKALEPSCKIIILGDENQLESIKPGSLLRDLIKSERFPTVFLNTIYRQGDGSSISTLSKQIINEENISPFKDAEVSIINTNNILNNIEKIVNKSYENGFDEYNTQILFANYKGEVGIDSINQLLHKPQHDIKVSYANHDFYVDDKIMVLKNQYDYDIYNGDIGKITKIIDKNAKGNDKCLQILIRDKTIDLAYRELELITHAYCISIHKSQGSEFDVVILPIKNTAFLTKKMIYTAITRAKKKLIIIGNVLHLNEGIKQNGHIRITNLTQLLKEG